MQSPLICLENKIQNALQKDIIEMSKSVLEAELALIKLKNAELQKELGSINLGMQKLTRYGVPKNFYPYLSCVSILYHSPADILVGE